jgi:hypothetical protein
MAYQVSNGSIWINIPSQAGHAYSFLVINYLYVIRIYICDKSSVRDISNKEKFNLPFIKKIISWMHFRCLSNSSCSVTSILRRTCWILENLRKYTADKFLRTVFVAPQVITWFTNCKLTLFSVMECRGCFVGIKLLQLEDKFTTPIIFYYYNYLVFIFLYICLLFW